VPNGIPCGLQSCTQLVHGVMKRWKIECNNTQHILCSVCPMFLTEFGVRNWWTYELWLIVDGIIMAPAACRLSFCLYWMCAVWCVELGMRRGVWWSLFCLNETGVPAFSHWTDETVGHNTSAMLTLSLTERLPKLSCQRCDSNIRGRFFTECNQEVFVR
jgi:hypothetical protein